MQGKAGAGEGRRGGAEQVEAGDGRRGGAEHGSVCTDSVRSFTSTGREQVKQAASGTATTEHR